MSKASHTEILQFILVGGLGASVNFASRIGFDVYFSYHVSIVLAYLVGMVVVFILFKHYVFEKSGRHYIEEIKYFILVHIAGIIQVWFISVGLAEYLFPYLEFSFYPEEVAHFIGLAVPAISSYFGHKYYSFGKK